MTKGLEYLISEIYGLCNCNESVLDKVIEKAKRIEEKIYTDDEVRKIIRNSQIRDEHNIFLYNNEEDVIKSIKKL